MKTLFNAKKLLLGMLVPFILLTDPLSTFAYEKNISYSPEKEISIKNKITKDNVKVYYDYVNDFYFTQPFRVEKGVKREISYEEYMSRVLEAKTFKETQAQRTNEILNSNSKLINDNGIIQPMMLTYSYQYGKAGEKIVLNTDKATRVSPTVTARDIDTNISVSISTSVSETFKGDFGVTAEIKKLIKATLTLGYSKTTVNSQTFSSSGTIPKGYSGYYQFTPRMLYTWGTVTQIEYTNYVECHRYYSSYTAYLPREVGGYADGDYVIKLTKL
ncbi:hypothetical protein EDD66_11214 [Mobilisporobacter senegalensis]|uniref:Toxin ETX/toxin MTX2 n=1 Tax=Mobilisporobacter senegalensis TaxID=1329262 RepID=A0A3N1XAV9_9FIRM|nr:hypothetical protein [Mobilisporobacter senegalensis]ROR23883.1 hypothetical protein EDD66_11214 [Mobilisporobacter senegalensis]